MIDSPTRLPAAAAAAPTAGPLPAPPDRLAQAQAAAHPFAELLRQNRLAATTPTAPAPEAKAESRPAATEASAGSEATPAEAAPSTRDATQAKARLASPSGGQSPSAQAPASPPSTDTSTSADTRAKQSDAKDPTATLPDASLIAGPGASARPDVAAPTEPGAGGEETRGQTPTASDGARARGGANRATAAKAPAASDAASAGSDPGKEPKVDAPAVASFAGVLADSRTSHAATAASLGDRPGHATATAAAPSPAFAGNVVPSTGSAGSAGAATTLSTPVHSPDFAAAFGLQVSVLAKDGVQRAELHLNPAEMGPVSIQITLDGSQARVDFGADAAATRHAIEAGLPELASALRDAGFTLAGGGVAQHSGSNGSDRSDADPGRASGAREPSAASKSLDAAAQRLTRRVAAGAVDLFA